MLSSAHECHRDNGKEDGNYYNGDISGLGFRALARRTYVALKRYAGMSNGYIGAWKSEMRTTVLLRVYKVA